MARKKKADSFVGKNQNTDYDNIKALGEKVDAVYDKNVFKSDVVYGLILVVGSALVAAGIYVLTGFM